MTIRSAITDLSGGVIRLSEVENATHGDNFIYTIPFRFIDHDVIEFIGVFNYDKPLPPSAWRVTMNECHRLGAKRIVYTRIKGGEKIKKSISVQKVKDAKTDHSQNNTDNISPFCIRIIRKLLSLFSRLYFQKRCNATNRTVGK